MRNAIRRMLIVAAVAALAVAASAATAEAAHPIHDVAVTGTDGKTLFSGTLKLEQFSAAPGGGIQVEIAGIVGIDGILVADRQEVGIQNVAVLTDPKLNQVVLGLELASPIQTTSGGKLSLDPINVTESQLAPGAKETLLALGELLSPQAGDVVAPSEAVAALLNVSFGLSPGAILIGLS